MIKKLSFTVLKPVNLIALQFSLIIAVVEAANFTFNSDGPENILGLLEATSTINVTGTDGLPITDVNVTVDTTAVQIGGAASTLSLTVREVNSNSMVTLLAEPSSLLQNTDIDNLTFNDQAAQPYTVTAPSPFGPGTFQPVPGSLSEFNGGNFNDGDWELTLGYSGIANTGNIGIDSWQLSVTTAIPEPQTYAMFATILVAAGIMYFRKQKKSRIEGPKIGKVKL